MNLSGIHLTLLAGKTLPVPASRAATEALGKIEIIHSDEGHSGFQITFKVGQDQASFLEPKLMQNPQFKSFSRVIVLVRLGLVPQVLMDGIITQQQFSPGDDPGTSTFILTGLDVGIMMGQEEKNEEHTAQSEAVIATKIIANYSQYGLIPMVISPPTLDVPVPTERVPTQQSSDLEYLQAIAERYNYVFFISPGPTPGTNTAYWGPLIRQGLPQKALSFNLGPNSNIESLSFKNDSLSPTGVSGQVQDRLTDTVLPVFSLSSLLPALSRNPPDLSNLLTARRRSLRTTGTSAAQAFAQAQAEADASTRDVVTAEGELSALRYGNVLQARSLVDVRGVGLSYSGTYYVKKVTHTITREDYKQTFTLAREGTGAVLPVVRV